MLAGSVGWKMKAVPRAQVLGFVPQLDLPALYGGATVTAYASVYEGFGLPPVEAMACGSAVVCTPVPAMALVGDGAVVARSSSAEDLWLALRQLVDDETARAELTSRARSAVARLSWRAAAAATAEVYERFGDTRRSTADDHRAPRAEEASTPPARPSPPGVRPARPGSHRRVRLTGRRPLVAEPPH